MHIPYFKEGVSHIPHLLQITLDYSYFPLHAGTGGERERVTLRLFAITSQVVIPKLPICGPGDGPAI